MSGDADPPSATAVTRVEFDLSGVEYPFFEVTAQESCTARLEEIIPRDEGYAEFFTFTGTEPETVFDAAETFDGVEAQLLTTNDEAGLFEFTVATDSCPAVHLAEAGALPRQIRGEDDTARLVADIPHSADPSAVIEAFLDEYEAAQLATKHEQSTATPIVGEWELQRLIATRFTDRQREVMRAAHEAGYYDWPRETDAQTLAEELGIASATLHKHLRAAERKLVTALFDDTGRR